MSLRSRGCDRCPFTLRDRKDRIDELCRRIDHGAGPVDYPHRITRSNQTVANEGILQIRGVDIKQSRALQDPVGIHRRQSIDKLIVLRLQNNLWHRKRLNRRTFALDIGLRIRERFQWNRLIGGSFIRS